MNPVLKKVLILVGGLIIVFLVLVIALGFIGGNRLNQAPELSIAVVEAASGDTALERGQHLALISSCNSCHGDDLSGLIFIDEAPIGYVPAPNLTAGAGGVGRSYTASDWSRAVRHGVGSDGRALVTMPSLHYAQYGDDDLAALIGYLQALPAVDNDLGSRAIQFPGTIIFGLLAYDGVASVAQIEHGSVGGQAPAAAASVEYGEYLVNIASCGSCHGENLAGATDPDSPQGPNITLGGPLQEWSENDFMTALRTGQTPDGRQLDTEMPWTNYATLTDLELQALWLYVAGVPALPDN